MENCGVTTVRSEDGELSWQELGQNFFEGTKCGKITIHDAYTHVIPQNNKF